MVALTPHGFYPLQTSPSPANRSPLALAGSDATAAATTALEAKTSPALASDPRRSTILREKKTKYRPLLGAAVDGPKRFVPFVLEASERLGPEGEPS